jgi:molybdopterin-synthase adenylyltransferase
VSLTREQLKRHSRQILLPEIGLNGIERLRESSVLVVGAGGLGSPVLTYLASSGVGRIRIAESDTLEISNLQRQFLYDTPNLGQPKLELAIQRLHALNPEVRLEGVGRLSTENAADCIGSCGLVLDCSDNIPTRHLISDTCAVLQKNHVWGAAEAFTGMCAVFSPMHTLRQTFPETTPRDDCDTIGVFAPLLGVIGSLMANNALKLLLKLEVEFSELIIYDALESSFRKIKLR